MKDDRVYLEHIRDALRDITAYTSTGRDAFVAEPMRQDATLRKLEVIGQAVKNLSEETKSRQQFDTANAHIAEGMIWAGLCAAVLKRFLAHGAQRVGKGTAMSTRRVAMCAHHILDDLVTALLVGVGLLGPLRRGLAYLLDNARRANVPRERRTGRLRAGLTIMPAVNDHL